MLQFDTPSTFTTSELAHLLGMSKQAISQLAVSQSWSFESYRGLKHGKFFLISSMPEELKNKVLGAWIMYQENSLMRKPKATSKKPDTLADNFLHKPEKAQVRALNRYKIMLEFIALVDMDMPIGKAIELIAKKYAVNPANIRNWYYGTSNKAGLRNIDRDQWLSALVDNYKGRKKPYAYFSDSSKSDTQIGNGE